MDQEDRAATPMVFVVDLDGGPFSLPTMTRGIASLHFREYWKIRGSNRGCARPKRRAGTGRGWAQDQPGRRISPGLGDVR